MRPDRPARRTANLPQCVAVSTFLGQITDLAAVTEEKASTANRAREGVTSTMVAEVAHWRQEH